MPSSLLQLASRALCRPPPSTSGRVGPSRPRAQTRVLAEFNSFEQRERKLRYPDGKERVIRYTGSDNTCARNSGPRIDAEKPRWLKANSTTSYEALTSWVDEGIDPQDAPSSPAMSGAERGSAETSDTSETSTSAFPDSPAALFRMLNSDTFKAAREAREDLVRKSYKIHRTNPYVENTVLYVLVTYHETNPADIFTMRTKTIREDSAAALGLPAGFTIQENIDGVLTFETEEDADRYAVLLEADGHKDIMLVDTPSEALFELTAQCSAVVVLFEKGSQAPMPQELAQALKGAVSIE